MLGNKDAKIKDLEHELEANNEELHVKEAEVQAKEAEIEAFKASYGQFLDHQKEMRKTRTHFGNKLGHKETTM